MKPATTGKIVAFIAVTLSSATLTTLAFVPPAFALSATDVVPVDISMIAQEGGKGITLQNTFAQPFYYYDRDKPNHSACLDKCAETWVPVYPTARDAVDMGPWTLVKRPDDSKQWAYNGKPLYTFGYGEHPPATAKEMGKEWHLVTP